MASKKSDIVWRVRVTCDEYAGDTRSYLIRASNAATAEVVAISRYKRQVKTDTSYVDSMEMLGSLVN